MMESNNQQISKEENGKVVLTKKDLNEIIYRSFLLQSSFNYERMQAGGWVYSLLPGLKKIYTDKKDLSNAMCDHMEFFNTSPQLVTFVHGVIIAMEEAKENRETIRGIKVSLMGPLGGIGDALFFMTLLPISAGIGASLALQGNVIGPFVFLIFYNVPMLAARYMLMKTGYTMGVSALPLLNENTKKISRAATIVGLMIIGALIAKSVNLNIAYILQAGAVSLNIQTELFDKIMPKFLPLIYTMSCFYGLKKGKNPIFIIAITVLLALVGAYFNVF